MALSFFAKDYSDDSCKGDARRAAEKQCADEEPSVGEIMCPIPEEC